MAKEMSGLDNPAFETEEANHYHVMSSCDTKCPGGPKPKKDRNKLAYTVTDVPPWYLCIFLGIQHYLTALGGLVAIPLILSKELCLTHDPLTQSHLISTIFFVSGICTLLQVLFGVR
ncbi:hypothetical protein FKM82_020002 [Ascaphus truei]